MHEVLEAVVVIGTEATLPDDEATSVQNHDRWHTLHIEHVQCCCLNIGMLWVGGEVTDESDVVVQVARLFDELKDFLRVVRVEGIGAVMTCNVIILKNCNFYQI